MSTRLQSDTRKNPSRDAEPACAHASRAIYIRAIIDVAAVLQDHPEPPNDAERSTAVSFDRRQIFVTATSGAADHATGNITLIAAAGDTVSLYAKSGSNNFGHAVLIDEIQVYGDDEILEDFKLLSMPQAAIVRAPADEQATALVEQQFWFRQCAIAGEGTQTASLKIALYDRDEIGQPRFAGLYRCDLKLTVQGSPLPPDVNA